MITTGFLLEKLSGGALRATQHRVVNRNSQPRFATALFFDPHPQANIEPMLPVKPEDSSRYVKCVAGHKGVRYAVGGYDAKAPVIPATAAATAAF
jgi:isopenicillin N synthase-like dioxygenase